MAIEPNRYKGVARDGKIELEEGANLPDGAEVVVLFEAAADAKRIVKLGDLLESGFVGMWADRDDLPKNPDDFREWRRALWKRKSA